MNFVTTGCPVFRLLILFVALVSKVYALLEFVKLAFKHLCKVARQLINLLFLFSDLCIFCLYQLLPCFVQLLNFFLKLYLSKLLRVYF